MHNGNYQKWYQSIGHQKIYIPKKNRHLAEQLAEKKYLSQLRDNLICEYNAISLYLKHHDSNVKTSDDISAKFPEFKELLSTRFSPLSQELHNWMYSEYEHNPNHPEHLIHKTVSGNYVRSKSEAIIAMLLSLKQVPYRYECALYLDGSTFFPDFTIRHPATGEYFYWEHFGLMNDSAYSKNVTTKLQHYISNGYIPTINLITTYETQNSPLSTELVEKIIQHYFL